MWILKYWCVRMLNLRNTESKHESWASFAVLVIFTSFKRLAWCLFRPVGFFLDPLREWEHENKCVAYISLISLTFASFLHVGAVVWSCQHGHRVAAVLSGEAVGKAPGHRVVEHLEGKLRNKHTLKTLLCYFPRGCAVDVSFIMTGHVFPAVGALLLLLWPLVSLTTPTVYLETNYSSVVNRGRELLTMFVSMMVKRLKLVVRVCFPT